MKRSPLAPLKKGGTREIRRVFLKKGGTRKENLQVPLLKGDLGGSHG